MPTRPVSTEQPRSQEIAAKMLELPANHSPMYAPQIAPTLDIGAAALVAAARKWLSET